ncbi:MAG: transglutaminase family protein [Acidobacteriota bacterium]
MNFGLKVIFVFTTLFLITCSVAGQTPLSARDAQLYDLARQDVGKFAREVAKGERSELGQAQAIVKWLATRFEWKATDYQKRTVQEIVDRRGGNCNELAMVATAAMKSLNIQLRSVHEINIHINDPDRGVRAAQMVKEKGLSYSAFGRRHNDHVWLELYDSKAKEWFPADPSSGLVGTEEWLKGRVWFGKRVTLNPLTNDMIVPFAIFAMDDQGKYTIDRTRHYVVDELDKLYRGRLDKSPAWKDWISGVTFLSEKAVGALAGTTNLQDYESQIDSLAETYEKLKPSSK